MSLNGTNRRQSRNGHRKLSRRSTKDDHSVGMDEFGIIHRDERSKSSDSVPVEDPSMHLTDDELSARIFEVSTTSQNESPATHGSKDGILGVTTSDSEAVLDNSAPSLGVVTSDLHLKLDELTADATGASEDFSKASDGETKRSGPTQSVKSSPHQEETESLTEFEEIERLIQANTAQDSDDNLSDIPLDLEQRILSGRVSRESCRSNRSATRLQMSNERPDSRQSSNSQSQQEGTQKIAEAGMQNSFHHHDTGYASEGLLNGTRATPEVGRSMVQESDEGDDDTTQYNNTEVQASVADTTVGEQTNTGAEASFDSHGAASTTESLNNVYQGETSQHDDNSEHESSDRNEGRARDETVDLFVLPTNRSDVGDTHQPNSLVATFGTTEDFEVLLQQQLQDMENEDNNDQAAIVSDDQFSTKSEHDVPYESTPDATPHTSLTYSRRKRLPEQPSTSQGNSPPSRQSRFSFRESPRSSNTRVGFQSVPAQKTKLKLSSRESSQSPREKSKIVMPNKSTTQRTRRSPAANRARRANNAAHGRPSRSTLARESSDDFSIRSDISRTELKSKLKEEAKTRKRDEEFVKELKNNYDELLMKYAEAENTIDHLRVGAKINLYATMPRPNPEDPTLPFEEAEVIRHPNQPYQGEVSEMLYNNGSQPYRKDSRHSISSDTLVESSLQLPVAATKEFYKVALQLQAKDLLDKIESFETLLKESDLSPGERQQAMETIEESLRNLEREYLTAIDEHAAEQRRLSIATGGSVDPNQPFDPGRVMEADIFGLGQRVRNLREHISTQTFPQFNYSPAQTSARSHPSPKQEQVQSSPKHDVDEQFNRLLHKYNRPVPTDDGHTTAPSLNMSSQDEGDGRRTADESTVEHRIPNRYLQHAGTPRDTPNITQHDTSAGKDSSPPFTRRPRYRSRFGTSMSSVNESMTSTSPSPTRSKLPRPVSKVSKEKRKPTSSDEKKGNRTVDKGTDSGFVGSESSRQSATLVEPAKVKLVSRPPTAVEVTQPPNVNPPKAAQRKSRTPSHASSSTLRSDNRCPREPMQPSTPSYIDKVGIYRAPDSSYTVDDSIDEISTTSTVREMLRPASRSYSTSSPPPPPAQTKHPSSSYPRGSKSGASLKSRGSSKRSVASTTKDSTLNMIRGEISRLRDEIKASKAQEPMQPIYTSTPRFPLSERNAAQMSSSDNEALKAIHSDIKALKDELHRQGRRRGSEVHSVKSTDAATTARPSRGERDGSPRSRRSRRSRSLGRGDLSEGSLDGSNAETTDRRRSRSQDRNRWKGGYWTYVAPPVHVTPAWATAPAGRTYTRAASPVPAVMTAPSQPTVYPVVHTTPIIGPPSNVVYIEPSSVAPTGRVYVPAPQRVNITPSKPQASIYISPKRSSSPMRSMRKANVYIVESDDDQPLRRSHLSGLKRSSSMSRLNRTSAYVPITDSKLNDSIERAERSAERLRAQSRSMYRSMRDDVYRAHLLADTL
ncbi:uncharacterized protein LOC143469294 isoform X2 [Clavelina lepadiformis]|uniref:uncharacterized protein LOC143469294 isoform X2 n=1 Tax=Clavelina lepadiformis TaxID=159417 RepID=UPI0040426058